MRIRRIEGGPHDPARRRRKSLPDRRIETVALASVNLAVGAGRVRLDHGPVRLRQEHAAEPDRPARRADEGARRARRPAGRQLQGPGLARDPQRGDRLRLPDLPPDPRPHVLDNVEIPLLYRRMSGSRAPQARARRARPGRASRSRVHHFPSQLSGGQQQRVAIARAIVGSPRILLADEPTGNLDSQMGDEIMAILAGPQRREKTTIVMVTHDPRQAETDRRGSSGCSTAGRSTEEASPMLQHYLKLAVKVLLRRKFFTFISLFGISFTLLVLMVATAMLDHAFGPHAPETKLRTARWACSARAMSGRALDPDRRRRLRAARPDYVREPPRRRAGLDLIQLDGRRRLVPGRRARHVLPEADRRRVLAASSTSAFWRAGRSRDEDETNGALRRRDQRADARAVLRRGPRRRAGRSRRTGRPSASSASCRTSPSCAHGPFADIWVPHQHGQERRVQARGDGRLPGDRPRAAAARTCRRCREEFNARLQPDRAAGSQELQPTSTRGGDHVRVGSPARCSTAGRQDGTAPSGLFALIIGRR